MSRSSDRVAKQKPSLAARFALLWLVLTVLNIGCGDQSQPESLLDQSLVLDQMPEGEVLTPTAIMQRGGDWESTLLGGRIDAGGESAFQPNELTFMVSQLPDAAHAEGDPDHADNCPFCKRELEKAPKAIVQFFDDSGNVRTGDPRAVLGLSQGDRVYITGTAHFDEALNTVMVKATGVYRDREG